MAMLRILEAFKPSMIFIKGSMGERLSGITSIVPLGLFSCHSLASFRLCSKGVNWFPKYTCPMESKVILNFSVSKGLAVTASAF